MSDIVERFERAVAANGYRTRDEHTEQEYESAKSSLRQLLSEKWQPMNIAPLDGTEILLRTKDGCVSCAWDKTDQEWVAGWLGLALLKSDPLGWMPIHKHEMHGGGE